MPREEEGEFRKISLSGSPRVWSIRTCLEFWLRLEAEAWRNRRIPEGREASRRTLFRCNRHMKQRMRGLKKGRAMGQNLAGASLGLNSVLATVDALLSLHSPILYL